MKFRADCSVSDCHGKAKFTISGERAGGRLCKTGMEKTFMLKRANDDGKGYTSA